MQRLFPLAIRRAAPSLYRSTSAFPLVQLLRFASSSASSAASAAPPVAAGSSPAVSSRRPTSNRRPIKRHAKNVGNLLARLVAVFADLPRGTKLTANETRTAFRRRHGDSWDFSAERVMAESGGTIVESVRNLPRFAQRFPSSFRVEVDEDGATTIAMIAPEDEARAIRVRENQLELADALHWTMTANEADPTIPRNHWDLERLFHQTHGESFTERAVRIDKRNPAGLPRGFGLLDFAESMPDTFIVQKTVLSTNVSLRPFVQIRRTKPNLTTAPASTWEEAEALEKRKQQNVARLTEAITAIFRDLQPDTPAAPSPDNNPVAVPGGRAVPILPRVHRTHTPVVANPRTQLSLPLDQSQLSAAFRARYGETFTSMSDRLERENRSDGLSFPNLRKFMQDRPQAFVMDERADSQMPVTFRAVL